MSSDCLLQRMKYIYTHTFIYIIQEWQISPSGYGKKMPFFFFLLLDVLFFFCYKMYLIPLSPLKLGSLLSSLWWHLSISCDLEPQEFSSWSSEASLLLPRLAVINAMAPSTRGHIYSGFCWTSSISSVPEDSFCSDPGCIRSGQSWGKLQEPLPAS